MRIYNASTGSHAGSYQLFELNYSKEEESRQSKLVENLKSEYRKSPNQELYDEIAKETEILGQKQKAVTEKRIQYIDREEKIKEKAYITEFKNKFRAV